MLTICWITSLVLSGCGNLPKFVYPTLDYTPSVALSVPVDEVRAFRVDVEHCMTERKYFGTNTFTEIQPTKAGTVPGQLTSGWTSQSGFFGALKNIDSTSHTVAVRLYRPGYELVEIPSWQIGRDVVWKPAKTLQQQEAALEALMPMQQLHRVNKSLAHQNALLFGATEWDRLAAKAEVQSDKERWQWNATELRRLARENQETDQEDAAADASARTVSQATISRADSGNH